MNIIHLNKKMLTITGIVTMIIALPVILFLAKQILDVRQGASGGTVGVTTAIPTGIKTINEEFNSDIKFDTQGNNITAFDLTLKYDNKILSGKSVSVNPPFTQVQAQISNDTGSIHLVGISKNAATGSVNVGKVVFKAIGVGSSNISYSEIEIAAMGSGSTNIASNQTPSTLTVGGPTPTPFSACPDDGGGGSVNQCRSTACLPGSTEVNGSGGNNGACKQFLGTSQGFCCNISVASQGLCPGGTSGNTCRTSCLSNETSVFNGDAICAKSLEITSGNNKCCKVNNSPTATPTTVLGTKTCYKDNDGDGFGNSAGGTKTNQSNCTNGWSLTNTDCDDLNPSVFPGQTNYFTSPRANGTYDYNCNQISDKRFQQHTFGTSPTATCFTTPPTGTVNFASDTACGQSGTFRICVRWNTTACGGLDTRESMSDSTGQSCPGYVAGYGWALVDTGSVTQECR